MAGVRVIRLFVSSPGDVDAERKRVEFVAERLNGLFAGVARFETIRWENKFYAAHASFQPQIPEATECDIVIGILWARLGSVLPPGFAKMPNGESYPSGTAYEVLSAIWKRQALDAQKDAERPVEKRPDVYIFQKQTPPFPPPRDEEDLAALDAQWKLLKSFIQHWFRSESGRFLAAFHSFRNTDEFEQQIEKLLRGWLAEHVLGARMVVWPVETKGSPFRGLEAFDAQHASVFFGRARDVTRAIDRLKTAAGVESAAAADQRMPFLLVTGPSGAGKSSLMRAGIVPRLTTPGVVEEIDIWRVAIMRPSDGASAFDALAEALFARAAPTGSADGTHYTAVPELAHGDYGTAPEFAALLRSGDLATRPIERVLDRIETAQREHAGFERRIRASLLLAVDQLDDLFAADVSAADRSQFAKALVALISTGRVWVVATLRAALYEQFLEESAFKFLKDTGASYDLAPPGVAELAEIVRRPAEAAGLVFDRNSQGELLDDRIVADAGNADTLPLLQFTLQRIFEKRELIDGEIRLTFAAYEAIGGLDGAINQAAEDALAGLGETEIAALPRIVRQLAVPVHDAANGLSGLFGVTVRAAPLREAAPDEAARKLVDALVAARIITTATDSAVPTIRIAHQRVLESWKRAQEIVRSNADFFRVRKEVENQWWKWRGLGRKSELLLARGLPLAEAEAMVARYRQELNPELCTFIAASGRHARLRQRLTAAAALVFGIVAVLAVISWRQAEANLDAAIAAISTLIETTSEIVRPIAQLDAVEGLIEQARDAMGRFSSISEDPRITKQRARSFLLLAETDWERGNVGRMRDEAQQAFALLDRLAAGGELEVRHLRAQSERLIGLAYVDADDKIAARTHYERGIADLTEMLSSGASEEVSWRWKRSLADLNQELGDVLLIKFNDVPNALTAFEHCYQERTDLTRFGHRGPALDHDIAWAANKLGDVAVRQGNDDDALKWFGIAQEGLTGLGENLWNNLMWPDHLALIDDNIGLIFKRREDFGEAVQYFAKAEELLERVVRHDPKNLFRRAGLSWTYFNGGEDQFRWALKSNDNDHLVQARDKFAASVAGYTSVNNGAPGHVQWQLALTAARANLAAVGAMTRQWAGDDYGAVAGFAVAADLMVTNFVPLADHYARPNFVASTIEFLDWAGTGAVKIGRIEEGRARMKIALEIVEKYRAVLGEKDYSSLKRRLREHFEALRS
jgi:tetratricopeptide (TPR) repeat protein